MLLLLLCARPRLPVNLAEPWIHGWTKAKGQGTQELSMAADDP